MTTKVLDHWYDLGDEGQGQKIYTKQNLIVSEDICNRLALSLTPY